MIHCALSDKSHQEMFAQLELFVGNVVVLLAFGPQLRAASVVYVIRVSGLVLDVQRLHLRRAALFVGVAKALAHFKLRMLLHELALGPLVCRGFA